MYVSISTILAVFFAICSGSPTNHGNAVKSALKYPFAVRIIVKFVHSRTNAVKMYACGGVIFSPSIVLTAAHCLYHKDERVVGVTVIAGKTNYGHSSPEEQVVNVKGYRVHKDYTSVNRNIVFIPNEFYTNDICILWLKTRLIETETIKAARLSEDDVLSEIIGTGLGFGPVSSNPSAKQLNQITLKAVPYNACRNTMKHKIGPNTFCAMSQHESCRNTQGDSGSAFVYNNKVLGLISFQTVNNEGNVCKNMPIVVTHIKKHAAMLIEYIKKGPPAEPCLKPKGKFCAL